jgi:hypothetical protein
MGYFTHAAGAPVQQRSDGVAPEALRPPTEHGEWPGPKESPQLSGSILCRGARSLTPAQASRGVYGSGDSAFQNPYMQVYRRISH